MKVIKLQIDYYSEPRNWLRKTWTYVNGNKRKTCKVKFREVDLGMPT
jgi:hypothetical protein